MNRGHTVPFQKRAPSEAAREQVEGQMNNNATGSVGMRAG